MQDTPNSANDREAAGEARAEQTAPARREVLATIGRFAYVAPALALLAEPKFAHAGYMVAAAATAAVASAAVTAAAPAAAVMGCTSATSAVATAATRGSFGDNRPLSTRSTRTSVSCSIPAGLAQRHSSMGSSSTTGVRAGCFSSTIPPHRYGARCGTATPRMRSSELSRTRTGSIPSRCGAISKPLLRQFVAPDCWGPASRARRAPCCVRRDNDRHWTLRTGSARSRSG
jgi:hypothetical protein